MTTKIIAERKFCRSNKMGQRFITGVALNKSSTVIMDFHNGELQVVMEKRIT